MFAKEARTRPIIPYQQGYKPSVGRKRGRREEGFILVSKTINVQIFFNEFRLETTRKYNLYNISL